MTRRSDQVAATLHRTLGEIIAGGLSDPRVEGMITLLGVSLSPDLKHAEVRVSVLPDRFARRSVSGLQHAAGHLQKEVGRRIRMKTVPQLHFRLDESIKKQADVLSAIRDAVSSDPSSGEAERRVGGIEGQDKEFSQ